MNSKPIQGGGISHHWKNPDDSFRYALTKVEFDCKIDHYAGVVIVSDEHYQNAICSRVNDLEKELPNLLSKIEGKAVAHWRVIENKDEANRVVSSLSAHPVFIG